LESNEDFQLVVADNSDTEELKDRLTDLLSDPRLLYSYDSRRLSVVDNFNSALDRAGGEYVAMLGDDDIIGCGFFEAIEWALSNKVDAVVMSEAVIVHYFWPGVKAANWGDIGGNLYFSDYSGEKERIDISSALSDAISHLGSGPRRLPRAYFGFVAKRVLDQVRKRFGAVFGGYSPDIYSSHLIALSCEVAYSIDYPIFIPGASPKSTSAARANRSDIGGLLDNDHLGRFSAVDWDPRIPKFYSPFTVWAQSHLDALRRTQTECPEGGFVYLYAKCLVFARGRSSEVLCAMRSNRSRRGFLWVLLRTFLAVAKIVFAHLLKKLPLIIRSRPGGAKYVVENISDTIVARRVLAKEMLEKHPQTAPNQE
jgi:glycosyltransferase involved in cell wall biosynthesis